MRIAPMTENTVRIFLNVLQQDPDNFPMNTIPYGSAPSPVVIFASFRRYLRHLLLAIARIDNEHAAQEYTRTVCSVNVPVLRSVPA